ncbi:acyl-CoA desaturase [Sorangium sp. So ce118]
MILESSATVESPVASEAHAAPAKWQRVTLRSKHLRTIQRIHAAATTLVPLAGTLLAAFVAARQGVRLLDVVLLSGMYSLTIVGITVGFHRHLSHLAFRAHPWVRALLMVAGSMAAQGPVIYWVANHRRHHQFSDQPGDPHSPFFDGDRQLGGLRGLWHAHTGWNFDHEMTNTAVYCKDLLRDPLVASINRRYYWWVALGLLAPALIGGAVTASWDGALSGFLWGGMVRLFLSYHATSGINSLTHYFGSRPFETREESRNNLLLVLPTFGEGWHNNHHAFPTSAFFGLKASQIDLGAWIVWTLERLSLAWDVRRPTSQQIEARLAASHSKHSTTMSDVPSWNRGD